MKLPLVIVIDGVHHQHTIEVAEATQAEAPVGVVLVPRQGYAKTNYHWWGGKLWIKNLRGDGTPVHSKATIIKLFLEKASNNHFDKTLEEAIAEIEAQASGILFIDDEVYYQTGEPRYTFQEHTPHPAISHNQPVFYYLAGEREQFIEAYREKIYSVVQEDYIEEDWFKDENIPLIEVLIPEAYGLTASRTSLEVDLDEGAMWFWKKEEVPSELKWYCSLLSPDVEYVFLVSGNVRTRMVHELMGLVSVGDEEFEREVEAHEVVVNNKLATLILVGEE